MTKNSSSGRSDEIAAERGAIVDFGEAGAGMRSARPDDEGKLWSGCDIGGRAARPGQIAQLRPGHDFGRRDIEACDAVQQTVQLVAIEIADAGAAD